MSGDQKSDDSVRLWRTSSAVAMIRLAAAVDVRSRHSR